MLCTGNRLVHLIDLRYQSEYSFPNVENNPPSAAFTDATYTERILARAPASPCHLQPIYFYDAEETRRTRISKSNKPPPTNGGRALVTLTLLLASENSEQRD